jgi:hypothetical protein
LDIFATAQRDRSNQVVGGNWTITDLAGGFDTGLTPQATVSGTQFIFTLTGPETYSVQFKRLSDGVTLLSHSGSLENANAGTIDSIEIALFGNGSGTDRRT